MRIGLKVRAQRLQGKEGGEFLACECLVDAPEATFQEFGDQAWPFPGTNLRRSNESLCSSLPAQLPVSNKGVLAGDVAADSQLNPVIQGDM